MGPRIAIVIPAYGHAMLLPEAVRSALSQEAPFPIHTIIVNDGCPDPEMHRVAATLTRAHPEQITYLRKPNGGLSSARNAGISYVLSTLPSVEALFMLDADNRLRPNAMARAMKALEANPEAGWVYPSIDMFGIRARCDYSGPYSRLIHSQMNVSEAGSLIRRSVFEAGVMFDETYLQGFEDWHFYLSAGDIGFKGVNEPEFGFLYRKRPESMLADADRDVAMLFARLRGDHPELYRPKQQVCLEHDEAPRYALRSGDTPLRLVTDPEASGEALSVEEFAARYWHAHTNPMAVRVPPFLVTLGAGAYEALQTAGLLHWALWQLEHTAEEHGISYLTLGPARQAGTVTVETGKPDDTNGRSRAIAWMIRAEALRDMVSGVELDLPMAMNPDKASAQNCVLRADTAKVTTANPILARTLHALHDVRVRQAGQRRWTWRQPSIGWRGKEHRIIRKSFEDQPAFPRIGRAGRREVALVTDRADTTAARSTLARLARERANGVHLHLVVLGTETGAVEMETVDSILLLGEGGFSASGPQIRHFESTPLLAQNRPGLLSAAAGMLFWLDTVHVAGSEAAHALAGPLRRLGIETVLHLHPTDISPDEDDSLTCALAYEHAYSCLVAPASLAAYLHARGIRRSKLETLP